MRNVRVLRSASTIVAVAIVVVVVVIEWSPQGVVVGLLGAIAGMLVGLTTLQVGMLTGASTLGVLVAQVVIGFGPRLREWRPRSSGNGGTTVVLRSVPLLLSVSVGPGRAPAIPRMRAAALVSALGGLLLAALAAWGAVDFADSPFGHGFALGALAVVARTMVPTRTVTSTSVGWLLFRLHRLGAEQSARFEAAPEVLRAIDAVQEGELAEADRLTGELVERYPGLRTVRAARILTLEASGRYTEALALAMRMTSDDQHQPHELAQSMAAFAGLVCVAIEAGDLDADVGLPIAARAVEDSVRLGQPTYKLDGARALVALLRGEPARAVRLARAAAAVSDDRIGRADDLATLARAYMAAGDNPAAREALTEAERLVPWWPRVAVARSRLDLA